MTKSSRNRRKERRAEIAEEIFDLSIMSGKSEHDVRKLDKALKNRTKEEIPAIRNPAY